MFYERDMTGDMNVTTKKIKAAIAFVLVGIAKKNTESRSWGEFVDGGGIGIGKTKAPENSMFIIIGMGKKKRVKGSSARVCLRWSNV